MPGNRLEAGCLPIQEPLAPVTSKRSGLALPIFLLALLVLGSAGIAAVYALHLNYPPIRSDGLGYYLYLPATFIYHDLSLKSIADFFASGAVRSAPPSLWRADGPLIWADTATYFIKYPMGEALLMTPFFLLACLLALVTGTPMDGFSPVFQYSAAFSGLCYTAAAVAVLWKVLSRDFRQSTILLVMVALVFGTDLFHYATYDSLFSHSYSLFLFSAFLYALQRLYPEGSGRWFAAAGALAGLIVLTRPTNGLWLLFGLLYGVDSRQGLAQRCAFFKSHLTRLCGALAIAAAIVSLQLAYWKLITGHFVVFSYQGEGFNFGDPQILNVLFSVRKGLFFWSPVLLTVFPGLYFCWKRAKAYFLPALLFLPLNLYVISSWHSWFYGGSFGHRAFIESFPIFAVCFCSLHEGIPAPWRRALTVFTIVCVTLSSWLMIKYWTGAIPYDGTTWDYFVRTFFSLTPSWLVR